jgi:thioredoxin 1
MFNKLLKTIGLTSGPPALPPEDQPSLTNRLAPVDVTDADFAEVVLGSDKLAVVDFWAEWCEPCHVMSAYVGFLAAEYDGRVLTTALDVDENQETSEKYDIMGLPTLVFFRDGLEVDRIVGVVNYQELRQRTENWLEIRSSSDF